ncbi:MAG: hypothetical protein J0L99_05940 [Chitinophagales bacterium]|nr:hypothetical protein [Chitinophagales bacterium]
MYRNKTIKKTAALTSAALLLACLLACKGKDAACTQPIRSEVYRINDPDFPIEICFNVDSTLVTDPDLRSVLFDNHDAIKYKGHLRSLSLKFIEDGPAYSKLDTAKICAGERKAMEMLYPQYHLDASQWLTTVYGEGAYTQISRGNLSYQSYVFDLHDAECSIVIEMSDSSDFLCKQEVFMKTIQSVRINK